MKQLKTITDLQRADLTDLVVMHNELEQVEGKHLRNACVARIRRGLVLLEARSRFPADQDFGEWRRRYLPQVSTRAASYMMQVAERYTTVHDDGRIEISPLVDATSFAVLREIVSLPTEKQKEFEERIATGEKVSKRDVQAAKSETGRHPGADRATDQSTDHTAHAGAHAYDPDSSIDWERAKRREGELRGSAREKRMAAEAMERADYSAPLVERADYLLKHGIGIDHSIQAAYFLLGLVVPEGDVRHSPDSVAAVIKVTRSRLHPDKGGSDDHMALFNRAVEAIEADYESVGLVL